MSGGKVLCETENLDPMPHSIFLLKPRIPSPYELGLLCLSLLCGQLILLTHYSHGLLLLKMEKEEIAKARR